MGDAVLLDEITSALSPCEHILFSLVAAKQPLSLLLRVCVCGEGGSVACTRFIATHAMHAWISDKKPPGGGREAPMRSGGCIAWSICGSHLWSLLRQQEFFCQLSRRLFLVHGNVVVVQWE